MAHPTREGDRFHSLGVRLAAGTAFGGLVILRNSRILHEANLGGRTSRVWVHLRDAFLHTGGQLGAPAGAEGLGDVAVVKEPSVASLFCRKETCRKWVRHETLAARVRFGSVAIKLESNEVDGRAVTSHNVPWELLGWPMLSNDRWVAVVALRAQEDALASVVGHRSNHVSL